ncbi:hypothetical protein COLO4_06379 [Corchorus olitorius]|uniref:Uncharacterized protein n=1 Tax=Corchorus olitorius TaxID=93759 RepID=A0A1R3KN59_9ROSI|nr:hypothetical protein COLO4_06379 [Corchorus olitorius]
MMASFYIGFSVTNPNYSTLHSFGFRSNAIGQLAAFPNMQSIRVLIINAGGVLNPDFARAFAELRYQHDPHLALITETRLGGVEGRNLRLSMNMPVS